MPITIANLTNRTDPMEYGVFDYLMESMKDHLDIEYDKGRIKGSEYAQVYLGSLQSVLQTAVTFLLTKDKADQEAKLIAAQILLAEQQKANAIVEGQNLVFQGEVLVAQKCKLQAEFDNLAVQKLRTEAENALLAQKIVTERAQTQAVGVDADSVLGKQKLLYEAQTTGYTRDSEQKAAQIMVDTWKIRRTTNETTEANATNRLSDDVVGRAVNKLLAGVGA